MILVFMTSTGEPNTQAVTPALLAQMRWQGTPSESMLLVNIVYLY